MEERGVCACKLENRAAEPPDEGRIVGEKPHGCQRTVSRVPGRSLLPKWDRSGSLGLIRESQSAVDAAALRKVPPGEGELPSRLRVMVKSGHEAVGQGTDQSGGVRRKPGPTAAARPPGDGDMPGGEGGCLRTRDLPAAPGINQKRRRSTVCRT